MLKNKYFKILAVCTLCFGLFSTIYVSANANKQVDEDTSPVMLQSAEDDFKRPRLPDARGTLADCYSTVVELGVMDDFIGDKVINVISFFPDMEELNDRINKIDWNKRVTRGEYAHIINQIRKLIELPKFDCCMGDTPNLIGIEDYNYYTDVKEASYNGLYCTRETNNPNNLLTFRELYKYIWKWAVSEPDVYTNIGRQQSFEMWKEYVNVYVASDETTLGTLWEEPQIVLDMLHDLDTAKFLRRDYLNRINLDDYVTLGDLICIVTNAMDYHMTFKELAKTGSNCTPCAMLGIEKFYVDLIKDE